MSNTIIQSRLLSYQCQTILEQENALKEIAQEIALLALSRANFFRIAVFQGGTCLRIFYGLERFSEDLDFVLKEKLTENFKWDNYVQHMQEEFIAHGFTLEVQPRQKLEGAVQTAFLKANSTGGILILKDQRSNKPKLRIKLEIDTDPPAYSEFELKYLDFPLPFSIQTQNLPSLFSGKCHALLCREYVKGRDWYDFSWYITRKTAINFPLLQEAINQVGPWVKQNIAVDKDWLCAQLDQKINEIDWREAKQDVAQFLKPKDWSVLELWSKDFFQSRLDKLRNYLSEITAE